MTRTPLGRADDPVGHADAARSGGPSRTSSRSSSTTGGARRRSAPRTGWVRPGVTIPVDAVVRSGGQPYGDMASIRVGNRRARPQPARLQPGGPRAGTARSGPAPPSTPSGIPPRAGGWRGGCRRFPPGAIVLGAVKDEASAQLGADAVAALASLGVRGDLRGRYRESHAFIGVKGAPPGSALEALGPRAVEVRVGEPGAGVRPRARGVRARAGGARPLTAPAGAA